MRNVRVIRGATLLATWFGCGRAPIAPGTIGTIGAIPLYLLVRGGGPLAVLSTALLITVVGVWASHVVADETKIKDPQFIVIDEVAGVLITLSVAHPTWPAVVTGAALFRLFDITKFPPARWAERALPGGYGIVLDDVIAGLWGAASLALLQRFFAL